MAIVEATLRTAGTYNLIAGAATTDVELLAGGGGGGNGGALQRGGGGGGGAYAGTPGLATTPGAAYALVVGNGGAATVAGGNTTFSSVTASNQRTAPAQSFTANNAIDQAAVGGLVLQPTSGTTPPTLVGSAGVVGENNPTQPALPAGLQVGDVIIAAVYTTSQSTTTPAGWTIHRSLLDSYYVASRVVESTAESGTTPWSIRSVRAFSYSVWRGGTLIQDYVGNVGAAADANAASVPVPASAAYGQGSIRVYVVPSRAGGTGITDLIYNIPSGVTSIYNTSGAGASVGRSALQAYEPLTQTLAAGAVLVRAAGGTQGANQSGLSAGAGGAGGTVANSIGTNRTAGGAGASGGDGGQGAAPLGGAGNVFGDGGAGGQILSAPGSPGQRGMAVIRFDTGTPVVTHLATMDRLATLSRVVANAIAHGAFFARVLTAARVALVALIPTATEIKSLTLPRSATITQTPTHRKDLNVYRSASLVLTPVALKALVLVAKSASIAHAPIFSRMVQAQRTLSASVAPTAIREGLLIIFLPRAATILHTPTVRKAVRVARSAQIVQTAVATKALDLTARLAQIVPTAYFTRAVTLRRVFSAQINHTRRTLLTLDADKIPREGDGGTVTQVFRNLFLFDD